MYWSALYNLIIFKHGTSSVDNVLNNVRPEMEQLLGSEQSSVENASRRSKGRVSDVSWNGTVLKNSKKSHYKNNLNFFVLLARQDVVLLLLNPWRCMDVV